MYCLSRNVYVKELKIKLIFSNFQTCCLEVSFRGLKLEKMHNTLYLFCFHMSYFLFWNQKRAVRKKSLNTFSFFHWQRTSLRCTRAFTIFSLSTGSQLIEIGIGDTGNQPPLEYRLFSRGGGGYVYFQY